MCASDITDHTILCSPPDSVSVLKSRLEALERLEALVLRYIANHEAIRRDGSFNKTAPVKEVILARVDLDGAGLPMAQPSMYDRKDRLRDPDLVFENQLMGYLLRAWMDRHGIEELEIDALAVTKCRLKPAVQVSETETGGIRAVAARLDEGGS